MAGKEISCKGAEAAVYVSIAGGGVHRSAEVAVYVSMAGSRNNTTRSVEAAVYVSMAGRRGVSLQRSGGSGMVTWQAEGYMQGAWRNMVRCGIESRYRIAESSSICEHVRQKSKLRMWRQQYDIAGRRVAMGDARREQCMSMAGRRVHARSAEGAVYV
jgi:hypothetical protein